MNKITTIFMCSSLKVNRCKAVSKVVLSLLFITAMQLQAQTFRGDVNLSDPFVMADEASGSYYMIGTSGDMFKSPDMEIWERLPWALRTNGIPWVGANHTSPAPTLIWAPELYHINGKYYAVVTFTNPKEKTHGTNYDRRSIHILKSDSPEGPYDVIENGDATYLPATKMAIDGTIWEENGEMYLVYCYEWVQAGDGAIEYVKLKPDLSGTEGPARTICHASDGRAWNDSPVTDGPFIFKTSTGRLGMIWTSWRNGVYVQGVSYSDNGRLDGNWTTSQMPIAPDNHGHGMLFRNFDGKLLMSIHSNRNIDLAQQHFERHPALFVMDDSGDELRAVMEYKQSYGLYDLAEVVVLNAGFDYSTNGWTCTGTAVNKGIASNQGGAITGNFYECWDSSSFTGEIFQELDVPNGTYRIEAAAFRSYPIDGVTEDNSAVYLFANDKITPVASDVPGKYGVTVTVTDGRLKFGIRSDRKVYQWMGIDNVAVRYYGTESLDESAIEEAENGGNAVYLKNKVTGKYLNAGESWGTQAVLDVHPLDLYPVKLSDGLYAIDTKISNGYENHYMGSNGYMDSNFAGFKLGIESNEEETTLSCNNKCWGADMNGNSIRTDYEASSPYALWIVKNKADLLSDMQSSTADNPVDATFLIKGANFSRNDTRIWKGWKGSFVVGGDVTNQCAEAKGRTFDVYQEVNKIPNGLYEVRMQGFYKRGSSGDEVYPSFYANDQSTLLCGASQSDGNVAPSTLLEASNAFSSGRYTNILNILVVDGHLRIGIRKNESRSGLEGWTVFDNFELYYKGDQSSSIEVPSENPANVSVKGIYDLYGRKISGDNQEMLPTGIYIINGKKTLIKN